MGEIACISEVFHTSILELLDFPIIDLYLIIPPTIESWRSLRSKNHG